MHYLGKAATFCLLYAFPLLLLGAHDGTLSDVARPIAWAFTIWGTGLYLWCRASSTSRQVARPGATPGAPARDR